MKYKGYRFYQSSYDNDEMGTILSVNHDFWGTFVTYLGYLLMGIGMILSLFNRNSHFQRLSRNLTELQEKKKNLKTTSIIVILALLPFFSAYSQAQLHGSNDNTAGTGQIIRKVLVQDPGGRIKPINSLSSELLRKISRKSYLWDNRATRYCWACLLFLNTGKPYP